jgi:aminoglycoside phosphotransferase (APT) family kinase protein
LVRRVAPGAKLVRAWEPEGGISAQVTACELERADGGTEKLIVRRHGAADLARNPRIAEDELRLLELLQAAGVPALRPRLAAPGAIVVEHVDGEVDAAPAGQAEFLGPFVAALVTIHRVETSGLSFLPERMLTDVRARPGEPEALRRIRDDLASASPLPRRNRPVLLHGDYWPGNTLWREGRLVAVLDWEDAAVGDPLADVANARLELLWARDAEAKEEFTRRYRALVPEVDFTDLSYWDQWAELRLAGISAG